MPLDDLVGIQDSHRATELAVAVGVSLGVFVSAAGLAFSFVHEKVKQLQDAAETLMEQKSN